MIVPVFVMPPRIGLADWTPLPILPVAVIVPLLTMPPVTVLPTMKFARMPTLMPAALPPGVSMAIKPLLVIPPETVLPKT